MNATEKKLLIARIVAAISILANTDNEHVTRLADLIGEDMSKLIPELLDEIVGNELFELILKYQAQLTKNIPTVKAEEPARIQLIN